MRKMMIRLNSEERDLRTENLCVGCDSDVEDRDVGLLAEGTRVVVAFSSDKREEGCCGVVHCSGIRQC